MEKPPNKKPHEFGKKPNNGGKKGPFGEGYKNPIISKANFEQVATGIAAMNRDELKRRIKNFKGKWKLDFTDKYLNGLNIDRLRHILLAAYVNGPKNPEDGSP